MLDLAGLDGTYERIRADRGVLTRTVGALRAGEWQGLNVTMPLKAAAADLADLLSPQAELSHSVNTLVPDGDTVAGHSTDSIAFRVLLRSDRFADISSILLLGAGGSAAAAMAAIGGQRQVYVCSRRPESAENLTSALGGAVVTWGTAVAGSLVINTTPLGMNREALPGDVLSVAGGFIDLPYGNAPTPAMVEARGLGLPRADGHEFLILQAIESFRLWTGVKTDYSALRRAMRNV